MAQQYDFKKGLEKFGEEGKKAVTEELAQLHKIKTWKPQDAKTLTQKQKGQALRNIMMLTQKRDGQIKARGVVDGSTQRNDKRYKKENNASPTVHTNSVLISCTIDAHKERDVAAINVPGAYLHSNLKRKDSTILMQLKGKVAELLVMLNPKLYHKYIY